MRSSRMGFELLSLPSAIVKLGFFQMVGFNDCDRVWGVVVVVVVVDEVERST
jgi:hypothetical protein